MVDRPGRPLSFLLVLCAVLTLVPGCAGGSDGAGGTGRSATASGQTIRIASFDFSESRVLTEVYAGALRRAGYPIQVLSGLGARDIVEPALEQGAVDLVVEYTGALRTFISPGAPLAEGQDVRAALTRYFTPLGVVVLDLAAAQDQNGFAVTAERARKHGLRRISDLAPMSRILAFGGPPECQQRPLCLRGLTERYGLRFREFHAMSSRAATAEALRSGEIEVGMLETTDARLGDGRLVLLADDRRLQPAENLVPLLRQRVVARHGDGPVRVLNAVTASLTTRELIRLNGRAELAGVAPDVVAAEWLDVHFRPDLTATPTARQTP